MSLLIFCLFFFFAHSIHVGSSVVVLEQCSIRMGPCWRRQGPLTCFPKIHRPLQETPCGTNMPSSISTMFWGCRTPHRCGCRADSTIAFVWTFNVCGRACLGAHMSPMKSRLVPDPDVWSANCTTKELHFFWRTQMQFQLAYPQTDTVKNHSRREATLAAGRLHRNNTADPILHAAIQHTRGRHEHGIFCIPPLTLGRKRPCCQMQCLSCDQQTPEESNANPWSLRWQTIPRQSRFLRFCCATSLERLAIDWFLPRHRKRALRVQ